MSRYTDANCKLCRREGQKLFLKGERCYSSKCAIERRNYAPGQHGQARKKQSDYGNQLREKQKAKRFYGMQETQFRNLFDKAAKKPGKTGENLTHEVARKMMEDDKSNMQNIANEKFLLDQLLSMDCLPCGYHRYYYLTDEMMKKELEEFGKHETRAESVKAVEAELFELYKDPNLHEMPELLKKRGGKY